VAVVGTEPGLAEPGCGARIDAACDVVRTGPAHASQQERLGAARGEPLGVDLGVELERRRRAGVHTLLAGFDPHPHRDIIEAGVAENVFELAGSMHRALGAPLACYGLNPRYVCNPVAYFDDTANTDEWQKEIYDRAHELANAGGYTRVLDIGCGSGYKLVHGFEPPRFETLGVDLPETVHVLERRYPSRRWMAVDLERETMLRFRADLIIASDIIEHLADPDVLLRFLADCDADVVLLSTPDAGLLVERGQAHPHGPPRNRHHVREWTRCEFARYVATHLDVVAQEVYPANATQLVVCRIPERRRVARSISASQTSAAVSRTDTRDASDATHGTHASRLCVVSESTRIAAPFTQNARAAAGFTSAATGGYAARSRTRACEAALARAESRLVTLACGDLDDYPTLAAPLEAAVLAGADIALRAAARTATGDWSPIDGFDAAVCDRAALLRAIARERGPHGVERALFRLIDGATRRHVEPARGACGAAALLARLEALIELLPSGPRWPDPRALLGPEVRRAIHDAQARGEGALAADLAGYFAAQTGAPPPQLPPGGRSEAHRGQTSAAPCHPELAVPLDAGTAWLPLDLRGADPHASWLAHARKPASARTLTLAAPWAAGIPLCAVTEGVLGALQSAGLDPRRIAPVVLLERPLLHAELAWLGATLGAPSGDA
jgi:SAM-dependent methyltransferase